MVAGYRSLNGQCNVLIPTMPTNQETQLRLSWEINAEAWTSAVRESRIPSRKAGTNEAVLSTLASLPKGQLLDVGCGEGWLSREAVQQGWSVTGIDASAALIERAREFPGAEFLVMDYADIPRCARLRRQFDCIVCNYSILGQDVHALLTSLRRLLQSRGSIVIQTVHPWTACGDQPYRDGWREETFQGWPGQFTASMPWFFRTLASWLSELSNAEFQVLTLVEPVDAATAWPLSLLLVCQPVLSEH